MTEAEIIALAASSIVELTKLITEAHKGKVPPADVLAKLQAAHDEMTADRATVDAEFAALEKKFDTSTAP